MISMSRLLSLAGLVPSGAKMLSFWSLFAFPHIPFMFPISKTEGIICRYWIQLPATIYFIIVPEGSVICQLFKKKPKSSHSLLKTHCKNMSYHKIIRIVHLLKFVLIQKININNFFLNKPSIAPLQFTTYII